MNRRKFISAMGAMGITSIALQTSCRAATNSRAHKNILNINSTRNIKNPMSFSPSNKLSALNDLPNTAKMPVLFLGHGSPMNAITETQF